MSDPTDGEDPASEGDPSWTPTLPNPQIDALIERLDSGAAVDPDEAYRLLALVAKEAQRLRTMVARLSAAKLAEADEQAREILAEAVGEADSLRSAGLHALTVRLAEAERVATAVRRSLEDHVARSAEMPGPVERDPGPIESDPDAEPL